ncbi:hypothetical protein MTCD1_02558 [Colwellia marinimaniae]|uniref:Uncharacterized protein n=1 Tax=Colwellia marinimaniae TaxID=1513592 RepID=A0ABQ0MX52_9GAMM|nr:hypothetical protein MTCD1_02558 [Colwellia marinimaniae]
MLSCKRNFTNAHMFLTRKYQDIVPMQYEMVYHGKILKSNRSKMRKTTNN